MVIQMGHTCLDATPLLWVFTKILPQMHGLQIKNQGTLQERHTLTHHYPGDRQTVGPTLTEEVRPDLPLTAELPAGMVLESFLVFEE